MHLASFGRWLIIGITGFNIVKAFDKANLDKEWIAVIETRIGHYKKEKEIQNCSKSKKTVWDSIQIFVLSVYCNDRTIYGLWYWIFICFYLSSSFLFLSLLGFCWNFSKKKKTNSADKKLSFFKFYFNKQTRLKMEQSLKKTLSDMRTDLDDICCTPYIMDSPSSINTRQRSVKGVDKTHVTQSCVIPQA